MGITQSNVDKLEAAGVVIKRPLPQAYEDVLNELTDDEVDVLVSVKERLDRAGESEGLAAAVRFANFIVI